jgi:hypothetical protein
MKIQPDEEQPAAWRLLPLMIAAVMIAYAVILLALVIADVDSTTRLVDRVSASAADRETRTGGAAP